MYPRHTVLTATVAPGSTDVTRYHGLDGFWTLVEVRRTRQSLFWICQLMCRARLVDIFVFCSRDGAELDGVTVIRSTDGMAAAVGAEE